MTTKVKSATTNEPARPLPKVRGATSVGIDDLRANLRAYLARAQVGEWFAVIDMRKAGPSGERGLEVARIGPPEAVVEKMIGGGNDEGENNGYGRAVIDAVRADGRPLYGRDIEVDSKMKAGMVRELKKFAKSKRRDRR